MGDFLEVVWADLDSGLEKRTTLRVTRLCARLCLGGESFGRILMSRCVWSCLLAKTSREMP